MLDWPNRAAPLDPCVERVGDNSIQKPNYLQHAPNGLSALVRCC
jgi:hypothetical protein